MRILPFLLLLFVGSAFGTTLVWEAPANASTVTGYNVYCGDYPLVETPSPLDAGMDLTWSDPGGVFAEGSAYECYVTAYSVDGESGHSNHVTFTEPAEPITVNIPGPPQSITITFE